jgi:4-alpha-glucanotransferase
VTALDGADRWGIGAGYHDVWGTWRTPSAATAAALRVAMGADPSEAADDDSRPPDGPPLRTARLGAADAVAIDGRGHLTLEDGSQLRHRGGRLPADLPAGLHRFDGDGGRTASHVEHVLVAPAAAPSLPPGRAWGITAQLYAARSRRSWGMGDLGDLGTLGRWTTEQGGATVGINPLHANAPGGPPANSPYSPSSRRFLDPIYLDVDRVLATSDAAATDPTVVAAAERARQLDGSGRIDRAAVWEAKRTALEAVWAERADRLAAELLRTSAGTSLGLWGAYSALAELHGPSWTSWPAELRRPTDPGVARATAELGHRVAFWVWLQHLVEDQLDATGARDWLVTDLAVGFAADGFDAWQWQDLVAPGCRIGAPPDLLGPDGQDWGLPPFVPWKLRRVGYQPLRETLRANLRHTRGLRIDHVMGLLRLFWLPPDASATDGAYVSWSGTELLDVVVLEAARAGSFVIGEDLGTVEPSTRDALRQRGLLSTRLLWFEDDPPERWPAPAMAAITTHDLPTIAGVWSGTDLADQRVAGVTVPDDGDEAFRHRLRVAASCDDAAPVADVIVAAHRHLATAPSVLATAALDDLVGAERRPNVPGTVDEHPNWRLPLPVLLDDLPTHPVATGVVAALRDERPSGPAGPGLSSPG